MWFALIRTIEITLKLVLKQIGFFLAHIESKSLKGAIFLKGHLHLTPLMVADDVVKHGAKISFIPNPI